MTPDEYRQQNLIVAEASRMHIEDVLSEVLRQLDHIGSTFDPSYFFCEGDAAEDSEIQIDVGREIDGHFKWYSCVWVPRKRFTLTEGDTKPLIAGILKAFEIEYDHELIAE